jgi:hypothetical protein
VTLVDPGVYDEERNLWQQAIVRADLGRSKVAVQAKRLRAVDTTIAVTALADPVEHVPLGALRADVLVACVDSRALRCRIGALAYRLGVPMIDTGVNGAALLARINVYRPGADQPCYECALDRRDYDTLEQVHPCTGRTITTPTDAPAALGALAAALAALECRKILDDAWDAVAVGRQVTADVGAHRTLVTRFARNPRCRFDHATWAIDRLAAGAAITSLADVLDAGRHGLGDAGELGLAVPEQPFVTGLACIDCGAHQALAPHLLGRLGTVARTCTACGGARRATGFDIVERLRRSDVTAEVAAAPLASLGLRAGDVLDVSDGRRTTYFELGGDA